ncbi:MAG: succinate dehydrogenase/fumarate reductase iron-sulfur subunit, partial [archaeon]
IRLQTRNDHQNDSNRKNLLASSGDSMNNGEIVEFTVFRLDPSKDEKPYYILYEIPYRSGMTVLDGLRQILEELDPTLSLRYSCRFKICGSCAMMINGVQRLACESQVSTMGRHIKVEPLAHFRILKDLVVDIEPFLKQMEAVMPYLVPKTQHQELRVDSRELEKYKSPSDCIWCGACTSTCPIASSEPYFVGPAALGQLYRFSVDSREEEGIRPLRLVLADSEASGVWRCHQIFACTKVCPKNIDLGSLIAELKRMVLTSRLTHQT